jgi:TonB family protein
MSLRTSLIILTLLPAIGFTSAVNAQSTTPRLTTPATFTDLDYPLGALVHNESGRAVLNLTVSPAGVATDATIATSSGSELLDRASIRLAKGRWRFEPAMQNGRAVTAMTQVEATWVLPLTPTTHEYIEVPDSSGASMAMPNAAYSARYFDYPPGAAAGGSQGVVGVRYQVDANGNVTGADVVAPASSPRFNSAALRIAKNRSFRPAMRAGSPVAVSQGLTVSFVVLPAQSARRQPPCYNEPVLGHDAVVVGTTPNRVEVSYFNAKYTTRWETRPVTDWVGIWVQVSASGDPTEVLLYTDNGWMVPSQPVAESLTRDREYPDNRGGCWYYDAVSILG